MLYLGIDRHAHQITISLRNDRAMPYWLGRCRRSRREFGRLQRHALRNASGHEKSVPTQTQWE